MARHGELSVGRVMALGALGTVSLFLLIRRMLRRLNYPTPAVCDICFENADDLKDR